MIGVDSQALVRFLIAEQAGATTTFTFDRALRGEALFSLLRP